MFAFLSILIYHFDTSNKRLWQKTLSENFSLEPKTMRKRSHLLEIAILGVLSDQDLHGYEVKRRLVDVLGLFSSLSFGSMYPALARLEEEGALEARGGSERSRSPIPLTGSLGGERAALRNQKSSLRPESRGVRGKKVFAITQVGHKRFTDFLVADSDPGEDEAAFKLRLAFARFLTAERRLGLLEQRRAYLIGHLAKAKSSAIQGQGLDPYAMSIIEHSKSATENDISWLDKLIQTERSRTA
ncbi:MAG TPA: PadR family transcriptional regulator [Acidimicrobiales bacterium]|nr:PadR family transcriptional regulator [Acidimicrobiales bacterium]